MCFSGAEVISNPLHTQYRYIQCYVKRAERLLHTQYRYIQYHVKKDWSKCRILTTIFENTITLVKTHGIFIWIKNFCVNCHISACQQIIIYVVHKELLSSGIGVSASRQLIIYLVDKELLSSGISVSASPDMFSLVLIYMNLGISAQLMFSLINVHIGTSA